MRERITTAVFLLPLPRPAKARHFWLAQPPPSQKNAKKLRILEENIDSRKKILPTSWIFHFLDFKPLSVEKIRHRVSLLKYHSLNMKIRRESRTLFPVLR